MPGGWPALQQLEDGWRGQVAGGHLERGREGCQQLLAQPVEQAALVTGGALVVTGDRPELGRQRAMRESGRRAA